MLHYYGRLDPGAFVKSVIWFKFQHNGCFWFLVGGCYGASDFGGRHSDQQQTADPLGIAFATSPLAAGRA